MVLRRLHGTRPTCSDLGKGLPLASRLQQVELVDAKFMLGALKDLIECFLSDTPANVTSLLEIILPTSITAFAQNFVRLGPIRVETRDEFTDGSATFAPVDEAFVRNQNTLDAATLERHLANMRAAR